MYLLPRPRGGGCKRACQQQGVGLTVAHACAVIERLGVPLAVVRDGEQTAIELVARLRRAIGPEAAGKLEAAALCAVSGEKQVGEGPGVRAVLRAEQALDLAKQELEHASVFLSVRALTGLAGLVADAVQVRD